MGAHRSALARLGIAMMVIAAASLAWLHPWSRAPAPPPPPAQLLDVQAIDATTVVVIALPVAGATVAAEGFESTDAGRSWRRFRVPPDAALRFVDRDHAFAAGPTRLEATADGGRSWQPRALPPAAPRAQLASWFLDLDHGWYLDRPVVSGTAVSRDLFRTADGGRTWEPVWHGSSGTARYPLFRDPLHGWMAADLSILGTVDGGRTWGAVPAPILDPPAAVVVAAQDLVEYSTRLGGAGGIVWNAAASSDGGSTWGPVRSVPGSDILGVAFVDARHWRAIAHYAVWRTDDGGDTWAPLTPRLPPGHWLGSSAFLDADQGWSLGGAGEAHYPTRVLRTADGGASWTVVSGPWTHG
jgi:photosystem II stability/assembly factor-like uncharacterized protein